MSGIYPFLTGLFEGFEICEIIEVEFAGVGKTKPSGYYYCGKNFSDIIKIMEKKCGQS